MVQFAPEADDDDREAEVDYVRLGATFAEEWEQRDTDGRRDLLSSALRHVVVKPGVRGRRGIDPERLDVHWVGSDAPEGGD